MVFEVEGEDGISVRFSSGLDSRGGWGVVVVASTWTSLVTTTSFLASLLASLMASLLASLLRFDPLTASAGFTLSLYFLDVFGLRGL